MNRINVRRQSEPPILPQQKRRTLELNPPERNPYNDPDYSPFIVTDGLSGQVGNESGGGGLLGMLRSVMQQGQVQPSADSISAPNDGPEHESDGYGGPQVGLLGRLLALPRKQARSAIDAYGNDGSGETSVAQMVTAPPREIPLIPPKPIRILSRRCIIQTLDCP